MSNPSDHSFWYDEATGHYDPPRTENGKPSVGAQVEGVASRGSPDAREPAPTFLGGCRNCGDPIVEEGFCGMCLEMGCIPADVGGSGK